MTHSHCDRCGRILKRGEVNNRWQQTTPRYDDCALEISIDLCNDCNKDFRNVFLRPPGEKTS